MYHSGPNLVTSATSIVFSVMYVWGGSGLGSAYLRGHARLGSGTDFRLSSTILVPLPTWGMFSWQKTGAQEVESNHDSTYQPPTESHLLTSDGQSRSVGAGMYILPIVGQEKE